MKKVIKNILYFLQINAILFVCYIWALFGIAFNDTGVQYNTISEALPTILFGVAPLVIGTIILVNVFKKKEDFLKYHFLIVQIIIIVGWIIFYMMNYVVDFSLNQYLDSKLYELSMNEQEKSNEKIKEELINGYEMIDSLENNTTKISLYINENTNKLIVESQIDGNINYNIIDIMKKDSKAEIKFSKYDEDYHIEFDKYNNLSIILNSNRYYMYSNCEIKNNYYDYTKQMLININGNRVNPIFEYKKMIEESLKNEEKRYYINDNKFLEIEKTDTGVKIKETSIKDKLSNDKYTWVIVCNGNILLQRAFKKSELVFEKDLIDEKFYGYLGDYEIYLKTYEDNIGYYRISNSVYWSNE